MLCRERVRAADMSDRAIDSCCIKLCLLRTSTSLAPSSSKICVCEFYRRIVCMDWTKSVIKAGDVIQRQQVSVFWFGKGSVAQKTQPSDYRLRKERPQNWSVYKFWWYRVKNWPTFVLAVWSPFDRELSLHSEYVGLFLTYDLPPPPNSTGPISAFISLCWSNSRGHNNRAEILPVFRMGVRGPPYQDILK